MDHDSVLKVCLFTDLVGSTDLKQRLGDRRAAALIAEHNELFRRSLADHDGTEQDNAGDGFFATFELPSDAVRCALAFQQGLAAGDGSERLHSRIGIHVGEISKVPGAQPEGGPSRFSGLAVDTTARVMSLGRGDQILLTRHAFDSVRQQLQSAPDGSAIEWHAHGPYLFKGVIDPLEIFEVGLPGLSPLAPPPASEKARRAVAPGDDETLGWRPAAGLPVPGREGWMLVKEIGKGGFGEVWLARHKKTRDVRAFKFCFKADRLRSLKRELTLFRLMKEVLGERPDIARLYEVQLDHAPYFLEMEYTAGGSLADWSAARGGIGAVPLDTRLELVAQVGDALAAAHSVGVIHKDVKPGNVLIHGDKDGTIQTRLTDFGIGQLVSTELLREAGITGTGFGTEQTQLTELGSRTGTRLYMAPELLAGKPSTIQSDVYALGVMLYQMVIADLDRPLAQGWERDVEDELLREDIAACIAGEPADRLPAADALARRLRTLGDRRTERDAERRKAAREEKRRRRLRIAGGVAVVLGLLLAIAAVGFVRERGLREEAEQARSAAVTARLAEAEQRQEVEARKEAERTLVLEQCLEAVLLIDPDRLHGYLDKAVELGISASTYHCYRGWAHILQYNLDEAWRELDKAVAADAGNAEAYYLRAILYAKDGKAMQAVDAFGKARKFDRGSVLELTCHGSAFVFLKQYKQGLVILDELVEKLRGQPAGRFMRGLARWLQLLRDPPVDMDQRWILATNALEDFNVAAGVHSDVPYIFDARADLVFRMAVMAEARGETQDAERLLRVARKDCDHLIEIGAPGGAHVHFAVHALDKGDLTAFLKYADRAYHVLLESKRRKSFNWQLAFESSVGLRLWAYYVRGDDKVTEELLRKLQEQHHEFSQSFEFGIVQAGVGDSTELRRDKADLGDPSDGGYGFGLWVGARARGDVRLAKHIAGRFAIKLLDPRDLFAALNPSAGVLDKHRWRRVFLGYIKGSEDSDALLTASGGSAHRLGLALLTTAMRSKSRASRMDHLRQILKMANPDRSWGCARGLLLRCEIDPAFLQTARGNNPSG